MTDHDLIDLLDLHLTSLIPGKSQNPYLLPSDSTLIAPYVSERLSSDDFVLGYTLRRIGEVQNVLSVYWKQRLGSAGIPNDLVAYGPGIDHHLPKPLRGMPDLWKRMPLQRKLVMDKLEIIPRLNLTGSAAKQYRENDGWVYGRKLRPGYRENDPLDEPIVTYTDKAPHGEHDQPLSSDEVEQANPDLTPLGLAVAAVISNDLESRGKARMADFKIEVGRDPQTQQRFVGDHVGTPYGSRIWSVEELALLAPGERPRPHDKDIVRVEMAELGIKDHSPNTPEGQAAVKALIPSSDFIVGVEQLFVDVVPLLTGMSLEEAQHRVLGIPEHCI